MSRRSTDPTSTTAICIARTCPRIDGEHAHALSGDQGLSLLGREGGLKGVEIDRQDEVVVLSVEYGRRDVPDRGRAVQSIRTLIPNEHAAVPQRGIYPGVCAKGPDSSVGPDFEEPLEIRVRDPLVGFELFEEEPWSRGIEQA